MINIAIDGSEIQYEAPDSAIAQLEAHETITGAKDLVEGTFVSIPFHAIDHVTVDRTPIISVTPSDDLCGGGVDCNSLKYYYRVSADDDAIELIDTFAALNGTQIELWCGDANHTISEKITSVAAVDTSIVSATEGEDGSWQLSLDSVGRTNVTITTESGCSYVVDVNSTDR